jgi:hypothetical protein
MPGVYGDMLSAFPELLEDYEVFKMDPRAVGGYGERYDKRTATGYLSHRKSRRAGHVSEALLKNDEATFWERHNVMTGESSIEQLDFMETKGKLWRFVEEDDFGKEGNFTRWTVQKVAGNTDQQVPHSTVRLGAEDF